MTGFTTNLATPARALAIAAHPDDVEFNCGATFAKWSAAGCVVNHLILTDGSKGSWDPAQDTEELIELRQEEQRAAALALGVDRRGRLRRLGRRRAGGDPGGAGRGRLVDPRASVPRSSWATTPGSATASTPTTGPPASWPATASSPPATPTSSPSTTSSPGARPTLLLFEADEPDHIEDVTHWVEPKLNALECHESQFETTMFKDLGEVASEREAFRARERELTGCHGRAGRLRPR